MVSKLEKLIQLENALLEVKKKLAEKNDIKNLDNLRGCAVYREYIKNVIIGTFLITDAHTINNWIKILKAKKYISRFIPSWLYENEEEHRQLLLKKETPTTEYTIHFNTIEQAQEKLQYEKIKKNPYTNKKTLYDSLPSSEAPKVKEPTHRRKTSMKNKPSLTGNHEHNVNIHNDWFKIKNHSELITLIRWYYILIMLLLIINY